jgi:hypothetical protein
VVVDDEHARRSTLELSVFVLNVGDDAGVRRCFTRVVKRVLVAVAPAMAAELLAEWLVAEGHDVVSEPMAADEPTDVDVAICDHPLGEGAHADRLVDVSGGQLSLDRLRALI